ncbi:MarR family transcriptional regulator [Flavobacterium sp. MFBS3-15]|uniref:MarR family winged helix-turn-helix transcriptional regulator n=1 Tax=Flavobacterium sp. MFBS3-15 TaxID=2989816 RepID=UPI00223600FC|nr:MarR family transcriptional regulator [Flavobacterium sp. MFBS3-15]MCW4468858.1 MarR family transcriptional regulator [Flavobacterium sp. MFBS3-15]
MKIEDAIKSTTALSPSKRTILNIMYTQNVLSETFNEVLKPHDLSTEQFNVLRILRGQKGKPANMGLIQERMISKTSNTTRLVDKLLLKGLVTREVCPENRRKMDITITEKGIKVLAQLDPEVDNHEQAYANNLTEDELQTFNLLLEKYRGEQ